MSGKNGRITAYINKKAIAANFQNMKANLKDGVKMVAVVRRNRTATVTVLCRSHTWPNRMIISGALR